MYINCLMFILYEKFSFVDEVSSRVTPFKTPKVSYSLLSKILCLCRLRKLE